MNVIEAAKKAGWNELGADLWGATHDGAMSKEALERFAQVIRNQALEDAEKAVDCSSVCFTADHVQIKQLAINAIRGMKKENQ